MASSSTRTLRAAALVAAAIVVGPLAPDARGQPAQAPSSGPSGNTSSIRPEPPVTPPQASPRPPGALTRIPFVLPRIHALLLTSARVRVRVSVDARGVARRVDVRSVTLAAREVDARGGRVASRLLERARWRVRASADLALARWRFGAKGDPGGATPGVVDVELTADLEAQYADIHRAPRIPAGAVILPPIHIREPDFGGAGHRVGHTVRLVRTITPRDEPDGFWVLGSSGRATIDLEAVRALGRSPIWPVRDAQGRERVAWQEVTVEFVGPPPAVAVSPDDGSGRSRAGTRGAVEARRRAGVARGEALWTRPVVAADRSFRAACIEAAQRARACWVGDGSEPEQVTAVWWARGGERWRWSLTRRSRVPAALASCLAVRLDALALPTMSRSVAARLSGELSCTFRPDGAGEPTVPWRSAAVSGLRYPRSSSMPGGRDATRMVDRMGDPARRRVR